MACTICQSGNTTSLGMRTPHIYCRACGAHEYEGQVIDKNTWNSWINGDTDRPARVSTRQSSPRAHRQ